MTISTRRWTLQRKWPQLGIWLLRLLFLVILALTAAVYVEALPRLGNMRFEWAVQEAYPAVTRAMPFAWYLNLLILERCLVALLFVVTSVVIFWRKAADAVAVIVATCLILLSFFFGFGGNTSSITLPAWLTPLAPLAQTALPALAAGGMVLLYAVFPDYRALPKSARFVVGAIGLLLVVAYGGWLEQLLPRQWRSAYAEAAWQASLVLIPSVLVLALTFQFAHMRRHPDPVRRQQAKWVALGLATPAAFMLIWTLALVLFDSPPWMHALEIVLWPLVWASIPVTIAIALFRFHLWEIDLVVSRTLIYGALAGLVILIYVLLVGGMSLIVREQDNILLFVLATGLVAFLIQPLHRRLQRGVNRLVYGERDDPLTVLQRLGEQLEATVVPAALLPNLAATVSRQLKLPYVAIELADTATVPAGVLAAGSRIEPVARFPIVYQGHALGALVVSPRAVGERLGVSDRAVLATVARQAGPAIHAARLTAELQRSRQALVAAQEEERRRVRRDLHDGLGPQLASQALTIDVILRTFERDPARARSLLTDLKQQSQDAIRDIRRVIYALRPPALDDLGLLIALREQAARHEQAGLRIRVVAEPEPLPPLPAAVEVAAYRIVQEALTNVLRHAHACTCIVTIKAGTNTLVVTVTDDGRGLPATAAPGVGMQSMRERAAELGGVCTTERLPTGGICVEAVLPLVA